MDKEKYLVFTSLRQRWKGLSIEERSAAISGPVDGAVYSDAYVLSEIRTQPDFAGRFLIVFSSVDGSRTDLVYSARSVLSFPEGESYAVVSDGVHQDYLSEGTCRLFNFEIAAALGETMHTNPVASVEHSDSEDRGDTFHTDILLVTLFDGTVETIKVAKVSNAGLTPLCTHEGCSMPPNFIAGRNMRFCAEHREALPNVEMLEVH